MKIENIPNWLIGSAFVVFVCILFWMAITGSKFSFGDKTIGFIYDRDISGATYLEARTDDKASFQIKHKINYDSIKGILVSIKHKNDAWHTIDVSNEFDNRFFWTTENIVGQIADKDLQFANRPVKIIVFQ